MERLGQRVPEATPVVQLYRGIALYWAGYRRRRARRLRRGEEGRARHASRDAQADNMLHPEYFPRTAIRSSSRRADALLEQGSRLQRAGPPALGRARLRAGGAAAAGRRRGAGRGRRRAFRQGQPEGLVLAARAARRGGSRAASPCATTSDCCSPGRASATRGDRQFRQARRARARARRSASGAASSSQGLRQVGQGNDKMSRSAYGVRPAAMRQFRIRLRRPHSAVGGP